MAVSPDLTCVKCRYALRGLDPRGRCPECGERIRRSAAAVRLARRNRAKGPIDVIAALESLVNVVLGTYALVFIADAIVQRYSRPRGPTMEPAPYMLAAIMLGFCFVLTWSSIRRSEGWLRVFAAVCALPAIIGAIRWFGLFLYWYAYISR